MFRVIMVLSLIAFISALSVVFIRQKSRLLYVDISQQLKIKDELDIEWNKLLTEKSVWTMYRIEKKAKDELGFHEPDLSEVEYIWVKP